MIVSYMIITYMITRKIILYPSLLYTKTLCALPQSPTFNLAQTSIKVSSLKFLLVSKGILIVPENPLISISIRQWYECFNYFKAIVFCVWKIEWRHFKNLFSNTNRRRHWSFTIDISFTVMKWGRSVASLPITLTA